MLAKRVSIWSRRITDRDGFANYCFRFSPDIVWDLMAEDVEKLGSEDDETIKERTELGKKLEILRSLTGKIVSDHCDRWIELFHLQDIFEVSRLGTNTEVVQDGVMFVILELCCSTFGLDGLGDGVKMFVTSTVGAGAALLGRRCISINFTLLL